MDVTSLQNEHNASPWCLGQCANILMPMIPFHFIQFFFALSAFSQLYSQLSLGHSTLYNLFPSSELTVTIRQPSMYHTKKGIHFRGHMGRGTQFDHAIQLSTQASGDGFDFNIPEAVHLMVNDWEDELCGALNVAGLNLE